MKYKTLISSALLSATSLFAVESPWNSLPDNTGFAMRVNNSKEMMETLKKETKYGKLLLNDAKIAEMKDKIYDIFGGDKGASSMIKKMNKIGLEPNDFTELLNANLGIAFTNVKMHHGKPNVNLFLWAEVSSELKKKLQASFLKEENTEYVIFEVEGGKVYQDDKGQLSVAFTEDYVVLSGLMDFDKNAPSDQKKALLEEGKKSLVQLLTAMNGDGTGAIEELNEASGFNSVKADGLTFIDVFVNGEPFKSFNPMVKMFLNPLGLDKIRKANLQYSYKDNKFVTTGFIEAPERNVGLAQLIEQPEIDFKPPAWVSKDVESYTVGSLSLSKVLDVAIQSGQMFQPAMTEQYVTMANQQLQQVLGVDVKTFVEAIKPTMHAVSYGFEDIQIGETSIPSQSYALILDFENAEVLEKLYGFVAQMTPQAQGAVKVVEEQGFKGFRISNPASPGVEFSLFLSQGKIIFSQGKLATERTLANIKNPPSPQQQLVNSKLYKKMKNETASQPGIVHTYSDGNRQMKESATVLSQLVNNPFMNKEAGFRKLMDLALLFLPKDGESEGLVGYTMGTMYLNDKGVVIKGETEFPAP